MDVVTIKGREYRPIRVKDSHDRRAQQYLNSLLSKLGKLGLTEDDVEVTLERAAFRNLPASITWYLDGKRMHYSCSTRSSHAENMYMVFLVVSTEIDALLAEETPFEDFVTKFVEEGDVEAQRKAARELLGLSETEKDMTVINTAYKDLARKHHPDVHGGDDTQFKEINRAHKTLKRELS